MANKNEGDGEDPPDAIYLSYDWEGDRNVSAKIVAGVAAVTDTPKNDLDPSLYEVVDPDALDTLWQPLNNGLRRAGDGQVELSIQECTVKFFSEGTIKIVPPEES